MQTHIENVISAINYIEEHLSENPSLDRVANAVHYSKYHLHRMFVNETGLTIHDYVQRRQLTEAARLLVFSDKPIMEIALVAGYGSQQAFTAIFKEMYKKTPNQYREEGEFYPLQLRYILNENPVKWESPDFWRQRIVPASFEDIPEWMNLVRLVIDGFPYLNEEEYVVRLREYIHCNRALILKDAGMAIGIMAFHEGTGSIDFLGVHPRYRKQGIVEAFLQEMAEGIVYPDCDITVTTFREGDKADTGYRKAFQKLGFAEGELLVEFGYPTQRLVLAGKRKKHIPLGATELLDLEEEMK